MRPIALAAFALFAACAAEESATPALPPLVLEMQGADDLAARATAFVLDDLARSDADGRLREAGDDALVIELATVAAAAVTAEGYRLTSSADGAVRVEASDLLGLQYGAWDALERAGVVWVHPLEAAWPTGWCRPCVADLDIAAVPGYAMRGTHMHTMHPIEYESTLLGHDPDTLPRFEALVGWLIARRQNFLQWALLRTVDWDRWIVHAGQLVDIAQARGMRIGISAPLAFRQQNSYFLVDGESPLPASEQIRLSVDSLMQAGWDHIGSEMGASEFFPVSDTEQVAQMSYLAQYLDERWDATTATKVHCTVNQTAPGYGDMNFNYIAQFTDPRMGVMPHTVQWYDLYRPGPTYDREDFFDMREFLLGEIGKRPVYYYPETAYWISFDNSVPLFLPQYVQARWLDLHALRDSGMDGQINFSSGFEWGYWLNDMAAAWYAYAPAETWTTVLDRALAPLGAAAGDATTILADYIERQGDDLLVKNGIRWIISWEPASDVGHFVGIHAQPIVERLYEVAKMDADDLTAFERDRMPQLLTLEPWLRGAADDWDALAPRVARGGAAIYDEFALGLRATALRAAWMERLYRAVVERRKAELGLPGADANAFDRLITEADEVKAAALRIVRRQERNYRFPYEEIGIDRPSHTSYPFGYLRTVSDLWYWERERKMVIDPHNFNFLDSLYDMYESSGL